MLEVLVGMPADSRDRVMRRAVEQFGLRPGPAPTPPARPAAVRVRPDPAITRSNPDVEGLEDFFQDDSRMDGGLTPRVDIPQGG